MPIRNEQGRTAVSALATAAVVVGGLTVLIFLVMAGADRPGPILGTLLGTGLTLGVIFWLLRDRSESAAGSPKLWKFSHRKKPEQEREIVLIRRDDDGADPLGNNEPPTLETIRDLRDHGSTWVPNQVGRDTRRSS